MSRVKTYPIEDYQLDDLMTALNLTRNDIPRVCGGLSPSAYGWWKHQGQIPQAHLEAFGRELQRQLQFRPKTDLDKKVEKFLGVAFAVMDLTGSAVPISPKSPFYQGPAKAKKAKTLDLASVELEALIAEIRRRGGTVSFAAKKSKK